MKILSKIRIRLYTLYAILFNNTIKKQLKDNFSIPIIIINYNQLTNLKNLINSLTKRGFHNIIIIDNNSTYPDLLDYYKELKQNPRIKLHELNENHGHMVLWIRKDILRLYSKGYYIITDPDILIGEDVPKDFVKIFIKLINKYQNIKKVGFSLQIDDIPNYYPNKEKVLKWERQFWDKQLKNGHYIGKIDTTFALYRPSFIYDSNHFESAIRTKYPYTVKHLGWYINYDKLSAEEKFYIKTANSSSSWLICDDSNLLNERANKHYDI